MMSKVEYLIKHNRAVQLLYRIFFSFWFTVLSFFVPIDEHLILFSSFSGKKYNDSPKVIFDTLKADERFKDYKMVWAFENPDQFKQENLITVKINSFKYFKTAFRAKYWITNVNIERGLNFKKKKQIYLNTWHGTGPKIIGNVVAGRKDYNFKKVNFLCADGEYLKNILVKNFNANPENILLCGRPREDILYHHNDSIKRRMYEKYGINKDDFVILYAPTWRESKNKNNQSVFNVDLDIKKILDSFPKAKILFRAHSITTEIHMNGSFTNRFISATSEQDISNLFFITDVLITDYSSSNLDFAILSKPFICYAPDYDEYIAKRPLCFDLQNEYPFGVQKNTDEVIQVLQRIINGDSKIKEVAAFKQKFGPYGGNATKICLDNLFADLPK